jgi:asparagine synthase (glutamine-hydrolysing)
MCGLAGKAIIGQPVLPPGTESQLRRMSAAVAHRGPDGENIVIDGPVGFAFRRLALMAPTGGDQPIFDAGKMVMLIANGEVYNHRELEAGFPAGLLRTGSDCEVLAQLYARDGTDFLDGVAGMFAIILYDKRRNKLVLARDRFGIKPLYFVRRGNTIVFASEIKALFQDPACPRELDWESALADQALHAAPFFSFKPVNPWFRGIEVVPAGTVIAIDLTTGDTRRREYWRLPDFAGDSAASDDEIITAYRDRLAASVADCASADAEVGLFLSGGVDSSAVAALAARTTAIHTFSVLNGSTFVNGDAESAHRVSAALGLPNHQLLFDTGRVPGADEWKRLLWLLETPLCGPEQYYKYELYRYVKRTRPGIKGMLLGQASDEFNGGYSVQVSGDTGWAGFEAALDGMARAGALQARPDLAPWLDHHDALVISDEMLRGRSSVMLDDPYRAFVTWKYRDIQQYNLWHEDRTAAGNGVEARVPFLDHRIIELMASIPPARRGRLLWDKAVLREAVRDLLPAAVTDRLKVSFYHGDGAEHTHRVFLRMLSQDAGALVEEALAAPGARDHLRPDAVRSMLRKLQAAPAPTGSEFILRLVNLGLLDAMTRQIPAPPAQAPTVALVPAASITNWDDDSAGLADRVCRPPVPDGADVVRLAGDVLVVHQPADPGTLYVAVGGQFEYVVREQEEPQWWLFLRHVDGQRSLSQILGVSGVPLSAVSGLLCDSIGAGLLTVEKAPAAEPAAQATGR